MLKSIFYILLLCSFIMCLSMSLIVPFFPPLALKRGVTEQTVGLIISAHPLGAFFCSLVVGRILNKSNQFKLMIASLFLLSIGLFVFGATYYIQNNLLLIAVGLTGRFINGVVRSEGSQMFLTPFYAYIPQVYQDVENKIAQAELSAGLGFLVGPIVGSFLYTLGGYTAPFYVFGIISLLLIPFINLQLKSKLRKVEHLINTVADEEALTSRKNTQSQINNLTYTDVLKKYRAFVPITAEFFVNFLISYPAPVAASFLEDKYKIEPKYVGLVYSISSLTYAIASIVAGKIQRGKKYYLFISILTVAIAEFFVGPDKYFTGLDPNILSYIIASSFLGIGTAFLFVHTLPLMNEILLQYYPDSKDEIANVSSALLNAGFSLGELLGPFAGGIISQRTGFERACSILGFALLGEAFVYLPLLIK